MTTTHRTATALAITAALALGVSGCGVNGNAAPRATTTVKPTEAAKADAFKKSEATLRNLDTIPVDGIVKVDYMTPDFLGETNTFRKKVKDHDAHIEGDGSIVKITPLQYGTRPKPTTSMRVCWDSDLRIIDNKTGKDLTQTEDRKPKPKGKTREASIYTLESQDAGATWLINGMTQDGKC